MDDLFSLNLFDEASETEHDPVDSDNGIADPNGPTPPGGLKETPSGKPYDAASIAIPGGDKESPSNSGYDLTSISVPAGSQIPLNTYNQILADLQKSYRESSEILEKLQTLIPVSQTVEEQQDQFTEDAIDNAVYESYLSGPVFEAVKAENKEEITKIVSSVKNKVAKYVEDNETKFIRPNKIMSAIRSAGNPVGVTTLKGASTLIYAPNFWVTRLWQIVGNIVIEEQNLNTLVGKLNEEFAEDLGEYKFITVKYTNNLMDVFRTKFNYKNHLGVFGLIVDKKMPVEMKALEKESAAPEKEEKKEDKKKE